MYIVTSNPEIHMGEDGSRILFSLLYFYSPCSLLVIFYEVPECERTHLLPKILSLEASSLACITHQNEGIGISSHQLDRRLILGLRRKGGELGGL